MGEAEEDDPWILLSTDLQNAFCQMLRAQCLWDVAEASPALARWLAVLWASGSTKVWQRAEQGWTAAQAERGAPQGLRSAQLAFNINATSLV